MSSGANMNGANMNGGPVEPMQTRGARLLLSDAALVTVRRHGEVGYPEEACGGLLGRAADGAIEVIEAVALTNVREADRHRRYLIAPDDVLALERRAAAADLEVVGYFHSHPDAPARPSAFDREHAWPWYVYLIVSIAEGRATEARAWRLSPDREGFDAVVLGDEDSLNMAPEES